MRASPYVGLVPYTREDTAFFFGRERERQVIAGNLLASRITLLYGPSGVGKSSVLRAGVIPDLEMLAAKTARADGRPEFAVAIFDAWRDDPATHLARRIDETLRQAVGAPLREPGVDVALTERLRRRTEELDIELLVVLDQFEEFFLYDTGEERAGSFGAQLAAASAEADLRVNFLLSIREDALARLDRFKDRIRNLFGNMLRVEHLDRAAATAAIVRPVERYNETERAGLPPIEVEPALIEAVLDQVRTGNVVLGDGAGVGARSRPADDDRVETPFLQLVMTRLWEAERAATPPSTVLRRSTLDALHGAVAIVRAHLETVMLQLEPDEQSAAASVFQYLVTRSGTKIAYPVLDLADEAGLDERLLSDVLEKLSARNVRVLRQVGPAPGNPAEPRFERYEIFHDVLAPAVLAWRSAWVQAQERQEAERESARIAAEAARAEANDRELAHAREIARISRQRVRMLALGALGALVLTAIALWQSVEARRQTDLATSRELAASANAAVDPELRIMLGIAGVEAAPTREAMDALQRAIQDSRLLLTIRGPGEGMFATLLADGNIITAGSDSTLRTWAAATGDSLGAVRLERDVAPWAYDARNRRLILLEGEAATERFAVLLWDLDGARAIARSGFHAVPQSPVSSIDGRLPLIRSDTALSIFAIPSEGSVVIFDAATGEERVLPGADSVIAVAVSPDGTRLAVADARGNIELRDALTGVRDAGFSRRGERAELVAFSPNGRALAAIDADGALLVLDAVMGFTLDSVPNAYANALAFGAGDRFAVATPDSVLATQYIGSAFWWSLRQSGVAILAISPDGGRLVSGTLDGEAAVWNVYSGERRLTLTGHTDIISSVAFTPDGNHVLTAAGDGTARIWELQSTLAYPAESAIRDLSFDSAGATYAIALSFRGIVVVDAATGRPTVESPDVFAERISLSPDGTRYVAASTDEITLREVMGSELATPLRGRAEPQESDGVELHVAWSPAGDRVAFSRRDRSVTIIGADGGDPIHRMAGSTAAVTAIEWSPDARTLAVGHANGEVVLFDTGSGERRAQIAAENAGSPARGPGAVSDIAFDPAGARIAIAGHDRRVRIRTLSSRGAPADLVHAGAVLSVDWSPDGGSIATAATDEVVRIWDLLDGSEEQRFVGRGIINVVRFTPDGSRLFVGGEDGMVRGFLLDRQELLDFAQSRVTRPMTAEECERYRTDRWCAG